MVSPVQAPQHMPPIRREGIISKSSVTQKAREDDEIG
jgi:hypothetical protein